jgi:uroporphyrinogen-III synthase
MATPVVGVTADRRWEEQADLFRRRGIEVLHGPSMRTIDLAGSAALRSATSSLIDAPPDVVVATTGGGMRAWLAAAEGWGLRAALQGALAGAVVVARGAKASSAVRQAGLDVAWRAPGESMAEVIEHLRAEPPLGRVAIQLFDPDDHPSTVAVRSLAGVTSVVEVPVYQWSPPDDTAPAHHLVDAAVAGDLAAVTFTSQPAVRFLFALAEATGQREALVQAFQSERVLAACIGPVCAEALVEGGVTTSIWPDPNRLPPLVRLVAERLGIAERPPATS